MQTKGVRMYGVHDLRLETFPLPPIEEGEILVKVISDTVCMSSHKMSALGPAHRRVPDDIDRNPILLGHEFAGEIIEVGAKWKHLYHPHMMFSVQPALDFEVSPYSLGCSFPYCGGDATYAIIPEVALSLGCLLPYSGDAFYMASLSEPLSCIVNAVRAQWHARPLQNVHEMGIREGGYCAIMGGAGPMGIGMAEYLLNGSEKKPGTLVVTDINRFRLDRAAAIQTVEKAKEHGIRLLYLNPDDYVNFRDTLMDATDGHGFDDCFVLTPTAEVVSLADKTLGYDGCLNFFSGPMDKDFSAVCNFYDIHYNAHHAIGTSGGSTKDMQEALRLMESGAMDPSGMITHIGGLPCVPETVVHLPELPGGKKLIYVHTSIPLTALADLHEKGKTDARYEELAHLVDAHGGLWNPQAEKYLLAHFTED